MPESSFEYPPTPTPDASLIAGRAAELQPFAPAVCESLQRWQGQLTILAQLTPSPTAQALRESAEAGLATAQQAVLETYQTQRRQLLGSALACLLRQQNQQLEGAVMTDSLTGATNRVGLERKYTEFREMLDTTRRTGALFFVDLDRFKTVNDNLGHQTGDQLLVITARVIRASMRGHERWLLAHGSREMLPTEDREHAVRLGGDEFACLAVFNDKLQVPDGETVLAQTVEEQAEALRARLSTGLKATLQGAVLLEASNQDWPPDDPHYAELSEVGASVGYSLIHPGDSRTLKDVLVHADEAMFATKRSAR